MKKHALFLFMLLLGLSYSSSAQKLITETPYVSGSQWFSKVTKRIPLKGGGLFYVYTETAGMIKLNYQVMVAVDGNGKKLFEIHAKQIPELKKDEFEFIYHESTNQFFGFSTKFVTSDVAKTKIDSKMICLQMDGTYKIVEDIPINKHLVAATVFGDQIVLLGLSGENKPDANDSEMPSGKMDAVMVDAKSLKMTHRDLNLPEFKAETGVSFFKLLGVKDNNLYFITEGRFRKGKEEITLVYEFLAYNLDKNEVAFKKQIPLEMGDVCPRPSSISRSDTEYTLCWLNRYAIDVPNVIFNNTTGDILVISSYGTGYPSNVLKREHEGFYIVMFDKGFDPKYTKKYPASKEQANEYAYKHYDRTHSFTLKRLSGVDYLIESANVTSFYDIELNSGDCKLIGAYSDISIEEQLITLKDASALSSVTSGLKKNKYSIKYCNGEGTNYILLDDYKTKTYRLYSF